MSNEKMRESFDAWFKAEFGNTYHTGKNDFWVVWKAAIDALAQQASEPAQVRTRETCSACSGSGYYDDDGSPDCSSCGGEGSVEVLSEPSQVSQPVDQQLLDFYNVKTVNELIAIQEHHIKRLQEKLAALNGSKDVFRPAFPRG